MHHWRVSKKQVFPIIITLLVQFHLPHVSLTSASAQGVLGAGPFILSADFDQTRVIPYREGGRSSREALRRGRLLGSGKGNSSRTAVSQPRSRVTTLTAYSSTKDQTDSSPCITANGYNVCKYNRENVIAANFLPLGTKVQIPELFGDRVFTVQDRMNRRYGNRVDVWMTSRARAKQFGVKRATIVVLPKEQKTVPVPAATQIAGNF